MNRLESLNFVNTFSSLPADFYSRVSTRPFESPELLHFNAEAASLIDLSPEEANRSDFAAILCGRNRWPGTDPLAMVYAGHQFGGYSPQLGDGRGLLLGEVQSSSGEIWDLHLKGAGPTPYSRFGDGRAVLRSSIREYLGSEAMWGLGIPTSRALCLISSTEPVQRETIEPAAMIVRLAQSHVRFGHFEYFFYSRKPEQLEQLLDYTIQRNFPELLVEHTPSVRHARFFDEVVQRTARLMAEWQAAGFAHGVMNTDNFSILGITFDYGPFGFLDAYEPGHICNHSDHSGRYAFNRQPSVALWNLNALAHALSGHIPKELLIESLNRFEQVMVEHWEHRMRSKLGLVARQESDSTLIGSLLDLMASDGVDYTIFWRQLSHFSPADPSSSPRDHFINRGAFDTWLATYTTRLQHENRPDAERQAEMCAANPKYVLRNWMAQLAIDNAHEGDASTIDTLLKLVHAPFEEHPEHERFAQLPPDWGRKMEISCSS